LGFGVLRLGFQVSVLCLGFEGLRFIIKESGFRISVEFRVYGLGFELWVFISYL